MSPLNSKAKQLEIWLCLDLNSHCDNEISLKLRKLWVPDLDFSSLVRRSEKECKNSTIVAH